MHITSSTRHDKHQHGTQQHLHKRRALILSGVCLCQLSQRQHDVCDHLGGHANIHLCTYG